MNDTYLREKIREAIRAGKLPERTPDGLWGGPGTGAECAVCGASTTPAEVEIEIEFTDDPLGSCNYVVHQHCYSMLELERQSRPNENWT